MLKSFFSLDGQDLFYEGYTDGSMWNGWACPLFEHEVAAAIARDYRPTDDTDPARPAAWYNAGDDSFVFLRNFEERFDVAAERFRGLDVPMGDGTTRRLYPVGRQAWCWVISAREAEPAHDSPDRIAPPVPDTIRIVPPSHPQSEGMVRKPFDLARFVEEREKEKSQGRDGR